VLSGEAPAARAVKLAAVLVQYDCCDN
jgi:hypothetical protein